MEIKLPKTYKDLRIKHLKPIQSDKYAGTMDLNLMVEFVSDFTGIKKSKLMSIDVKDIAKLSNHIASLYASMPVVKHPPKEITINGKTYELVNPEKIGVGWHIDWANGDIEKDPVRMACLMYYPKGAIYGEVDAYDNLINPIKDRYKEFENHLPLSTFLEASNFFATLRNINEAIHGQRNNATESEKVKPFQWEEVIDDVSKEFNMTWHEVTRMNIFAFNHKCKYLVHKRKKEIANKRGR